MSNIKSKLKLGKRIKQARHEMGWSQKELAQKLKLSDKAISSYEVNRATPSFLTLKKISRVVHKPIAYFDDGVDSDNLDLQIKIKIVEKELLEIKKLLKKKSRSNTP